MIRRETSTGHGSQDRKRYTEKIRERIRQALPTLPGEIPVVSGPGDQPVTMPIPGGGLSLPRFVPRRPSEPSKSFGQGEAQPGDVVDAQPRKRGQGGGDDGPGDDDIAITMTLDEWRQWMLEDLALPDLTPRPNDQIAETETVWTSRSRTGSMSTIDKRATLKEALARSQSQGEALTFRPDDLRYRSWEDRARPHTAAVIYFCRDISASMDGERQYLARATAWYLSAALSRVYTTCPVRFWVHALAAQAVSEAEFLGMGSGGGTMAGPAYAAMQDDMDKEFPPSTFHRYVFHFTDGVIADEEAAWGVLASWFPTLTRFGLVLVDKPGRLYEWLAAVAAQAVGRVVIASDRDQVVPAIHELLQEGSP